MVSLPPKPVGADAAWDTVCNSSNISDDIYSRYHNNPDLASYLAVRSLRQPDGELPLSPGDAFNHDLQILAWDHFNQEAVKQQDLIGNISIKERGTVYQVVTALKFKRNLFYKAKKLQKKKKSNTNAIVWQWPDAMRYKLVIEQVFGENWHNIVAMYKLYEFSADPVEQLDVLLGPNDNQLIELAKNLTGKETAWDAATAVGKQKGGSSAAKLLRTINKKLGEENTEVHEVPRVMYVGVCGGAPVGAFPVTSIEGIQTALRTKHNCPDPDNLEKAVRLLFHKLENIGNENDADVKFG